MSLFRIHSPNLAYPENASCPLSAFPTFRIQASHHVRMKELANRRGGAACSSPSNWLLRLMKLFYTFSLKIIT